MKFGAQTKGAEKERERERDRQTEKWYATFVHHNSNHMFAYCYIVYGALPPVVFCLALLRSTFHFILFVLKITTHFFALQSKKLKWRKKKRDHWIGVWHWSPGSGPVHTVHTSTCFIFGKSSDDGSRKEKPNYDTFRMWLWVSGIVTQDRPSQSFFSSSRSYSK